VGTGNAFGYADAGLNVKFTDTAANNIHFYQAVDGYSIADGATWRPDGQTINPVTSPPSAFDAPGTVTLGVFSGMNPNGDWMLVLADVSSGSGQATVLSWGLDIQVVPEPVHVALGVFGGLFAAVQLATRRERADFEISHTSVYWPKLDCDISSDCLLRGAKEARKFAERAWRKKAKLAAA
jgi:hypothetical protein